MRVAEILDKITHTLKGIGTIEESRMKQLEIQMYEVVEEIWKKVEWKALEYFQEDFWKKMEWKPLEA